MEVRSKNISVAEKDLLNYQLKKFEVLLKRKAGQYCLLDWKKGKIVPSGEQKTYNDYKIVKNKQTKKVIAWLKKANALLEKEDLLGGKILVSVRKT